MDNALYKYKGKSWRSCLTKSDTNSFFHSAFGTRDREGEEYLVKDAQFRQIRWETFLTYFVSQSMPPSLADTLRKCFSADAKHKNASIGDMENFMKYASGILASERNVTIEEIPILATLENVQIVVFSSTRPDAVTIVTPNPDILGNYPTVEKAKGEVVLCQEGETFSKLELVKDVRTPKPNKNIVRNKTAKGNSIRSNNNSDKYRKGGSAGSKGIQYQVNLLAMVLLNAFRNLQEWKLSTENEDAGKFDDIVLEQTEGATFIQSKHKESGKTKITLNELTSTNSKNDDFSLPKYFLSYLQIKTRFKIKNVILCTNANVHEKALKLLDRHDACSDSILYFERNYSFHTIKDEMLPSLKESIKSYHQQNFKKKGIEESEINDENLKGFQKHLQLYFNYPSLKSMGTIIDKSLSLIRCCKSSSGKIVSSEIFSKMMESLQQEEGIYLTQTLAKAIFSEIWTEKYCQKLEEYDVSFNRDDLNFQPPNQIFHIIINGGYLLQVLKIYHAVRDDKTKILFVNLHDDINIHKQAVEAFELPQYTFLIIILPKTTKESPVMEAFGELKGILRNRDYKKIIVVAEDNDGFFQRIGWDKDVVRVSKPVTFKDLHSLSQERILKKKNIVFQGEKVSLEEILETQKIEDYGKALNTEILEKLIRGDQVKVGIRPSELDEYNSRYYIIRTFKRNLDKTPDEKRDKGKKKENFLDGTHSSGRDFTLRYKSPTLNKELFGELGKIYSDEMKQEEIFFEENIYDVKEKVVIISDSAGTGKSTVLARLALIIKEINPHLWVIRIELNDYTKFLRDSLRNGNKTVNITELLNSEKATKLKNHLEEFLFFTNQKVVLLFDGVDEISPDYTELILGLLRQCQEESGFTKIFITTRPHMIKELEQVSRVKPFMLEPFTEQNQIKFLVDYWEYGLQLKDDVSKGKCGRYAEALIKKWRNLDNNEGNRFTTIPLQLRMMAEIFKENAGSIDSTDWEGCKEFVMGSEVQPNISERMNIADLYRMFVEKKQHIFAEKGNPSGNTIANGSITETFNNIEKQMLKIGIIQKTKEEMHFIHRTFADYFVADCLLSELQQNPTLEFQKFLIDTIFAHPLYKVTRIFFDSLLRKVEKFLSADIFKEYRFLKQESSMEFYKLQSRLLHLLAEGDCMAIFLFILKCIEYKAVTGKEINILKFYRTHFNEDVQKNIFGNTLNLLQYLTKEAGVNIKDEEGWTPLHYAAEKGHLEMVKLLVEAGADVNSKNNFGNNPLHLASEGGHLNTVKYLFELGIDLHIRDNDGFTALQTATYFGHLEIVKFLKERGSDINVVSNDGGTLLHSASERGHLDVIKYIFELDIDLHIRDNDGLTALQTATYFGQLEIVKFLKERGSDINVLSNIGSTLFHLASERGHSDIIKYLFELGIDPHIRKNNGFTALQMATYFGHLEIVKFLQERGSDINVLSNIGSTLLHLASERGHLDIIKYLCEFGIDPHIKDNNGLMALQTAIYFGHLEIVKFLKERGSDINVVSNDGNTLLHSASRNGHLDTIQYLLEIGVDFNITDRYGFTVLQSTTQCGDLKTIKFLVEYGFDIKILSNSCYTLLHLACANGRLDTTKYLLELGMDPNIRNNHGFTAFHLVDGEDQSEIVKCFIDYGLDIDIKSAKGLTLLHLTSADGRLEMVKFLLENGADFGIRDNDGFTPLHLAAAWGQLGAVKLLVEYCLGYNATTNDGRTPLHLSSQEGHSDTVKSFLELGVDCNVRDYSGRTALHLAVLADHLDVVKLLVEHGGDLKVEDNGGHTALHLAVDIDDSDTIDFLMEMETD